MSRGGIINRNLDKIIYLMKVIGINTLNIAINMYITVHNIAIK